MNWAWFFGGVAACVALEAIGIVSLALIMEFRGENSARGRLKDVKEALDSLKEHGDSPEAIGEIEEIIDRE